MTSAGSDSADELPDTVGAVVGTRIDRLAPPDRALLRWASVLGVVFDGDVIHDVLAGDPAAAAELGRMGAAGRVHRTRPVRRGRVPLPPRPDSRRRVRRAPVPASPRAARSASARSSNRVTPTRSRRSRSSYRCISRSPGMRRATWRYSLLAGERAKEKFANVEAAEFYRRALDVASTLEPDDAERARVWEALAEVCRARRPARGGAKTRSRRRGSTRTPGRSRRR